MKSNMSLKVILSITCIVMFCGFGCAHSGKKHSGETEVRTLGYLQLKIPYSKASHEEGDLQAIKIVMANKHSKTGRPYPCWNALKPFKKRNLPASLTISSTDEEATKEFFSLSEIDSRKFDNVGKDGKFSNLRPIKKEGYYIWRIDMAHKRLPMNLLPDTVVGLVDVSGSMNAKKKLNTLRGLSSSNIKFKKIYSFSDNGSLKTIDIGNLIKMKPEGHTALYDNLIELTNKEPDSEIIVVTDGKDNRSTIKIDDLLKIISANHHKIDVVLTGRDVRKNFFKVANTTGGQTLTDLDETGFILLPHLEVSIEE